MKKILTVVLVLAIAITSVACSSKPAPSSSSTPVSGSIPASSSEPEPEPVKKYERPVDYVKQGYGEVWYPEVDSLTLVYHPAIKTIADALSKDFAWPTELTDDWKSWGYSDIHVSANGFSYRTSASKDYVAKHATQIMDHIKAMKATSTDFAYSLTGESENGVPYSELTMAAGTDMAKVKEACFEALYLQAWTLIPEEFQGVTVTLGDKVLTLDEVLAS